MLKVSAVRQRFRSGFWMKEVEVLKGIDFEVPRGSVFGFLGPNGAGKTTLIHLIVGIRQPYHGSVQLDGVDCQLPEARQRIGYLPERPYFYDHLTGRKLLQYFGALSKVDRATVDACIPSVLEAVGMKHAADRELRKYSKGMLQRIGIAQALIHDPDFLVLDEPMSGLDPIGRKEMRELIQRLAREGKTIFFSSHVIPDVEAICDRIAVIKNGELVGNGAVSSFLKTDLSDREILITGVEAARIQSIPGVTQVQPLPEGLRVICARDADLNDTVTAVMKQGGKLISVQPIRPSLEDFFA